MCLDERAVGALRAYREVLEDDADTISVRADIVSNCFTTLRQRLDGPWVGSSLTLLDMNQLRDALTVLLDTAAAAQARLEAVIAVLERVEE